MGLAGCRMPQERALPFKCWPRETSQRRKRELFKTRGNWMKARRGRREIGAGPCPGDGRSAKNENGIPPGEEEEDEEEEVEDEKEEEGVPPFLRGSRQARCRATT
ncbi:hypothetical protein KM043_010260 [Ampulex compressa]|nr:hypothetical protein KM043_010260 [Ampulex compressa]